ncbi:hypothetical protein [Paenibacillus lemnae]|uniref:Uncharacterized protein n=1 Tax=Paenibacillus lemnae TaxID=1330551 RepID=A0A848MDH8_PAELE|nr:hypothetical protein [Paenibacillus lemnae]NMO98143.1 hypothetical protein [Paenibacillus lemnae]
MVAHLLWILAAYGAAVLLVHVMHARYVKRSADQNRVVQYVLVTSNHERKVEWIVRALSLYALLHGVRVQVTFYDEQSGDQTLAILHRLSGCPDVELKVMDLDDSEKEKLKLRLRNSRKKEDRGIYIDLRVPAGAARIPYVQ